MKAIQTSVYKKYVKLFRNHNTGPKMINGFSLIEVMITMAIVSIVLAAVYSVHAGLTRSYTSQNVAADVQQTVRAGTDYMIEDIMMAGFDPESVAGAGIEVASSSNLRFSMDLNMNGVVDESDEEIITYSYSGVNNRIRQGLYEGTASENWNDFIENVTNFTLVYLDSAGNDLGNPIPNSNLADIRTIIISMTVQESAGRKGMIDRTYTTRINCRNLGL